VKALSQAVETDLAQTVTRVKVKAIGQVVSMTGSKPFP
jgi:hypothetical protein